MRESEHRLLEAQRIAGLGNWEWNLRSGETRWSPEIYAIHGLSLDAPTFTSATLLQHVHPEDRAGIQAEWDRCVATRSPFQYEYRVIWPDGSVHWLSARGVFQYDHQDAPTRLLGILMDITERKQAEAQLRLQAVAMQSAANAVVIARRDEFLGDQIHSVVQRGYSEAS